MQRDMVRYSSHEQITPYVLASKPGLVGIKPQQSILIYLACSISHGNSIPTLKWIKVQ